VRVANAAVGIDAEAETNEQFPWDAVQRMNGKKTYGIAFGR
jgi:hypothetical protein